MSSQLICNQYSTIEDAALADALWTTYIEAFGDAGTACIQDQLCYSRETFESALADRDYVKFVVTSGTEVNGFILCTNNLEKARVAYVNPGRLKAQFPQYVGRIYYYTAIAVRPSKQGKHVASLLVATAGALMDSLDGLVVFDYSAEKNPFMSELVAGGLRAAQSKDGSGWTSDSVEVTPLGGQQYVAIELKKKTDQ